MATPTGDDWRLSEFHSSESGERRLFRKNLAPSVAPGDPRYSHVAYVTLAYARHDASGLPSGPDFDELASAEDALIDACERDGCAVCVAVVLQRGVKDLLFYASDPEQFAGLVATALRPFADREPALEVLHDPAWSHYDEFP